MTCSGHAGVRFKPPTGQGFTEMEAEVVKLLSMDGGSGLKRSEDSFGYAWLVVEDSDIESLVTRVHLVNSSLSDAGWGPQLPCSVFGLAQLVTDTTADTGSDTVRRGRPSGPARWSPPRPTWSTCSNGARSIPSCPPVTNSVSTEEEFRMPQPGRRRPRVEPDLDRWFPLWDLPVA